MFLLLTVLGNFYIVEPGERGVRVTLGKMSNEAIAPGLGMKLPWVTAIKKVNVQQNTKEVLAECFSSDLQQVHITLKVLYRIPEARCRGHPA